MARLPECRPCPGARSPGSCEKLLQILQAGIYGPQDAELQARRAHDADLKCGLKEADKRVAAYDAGLRAETEQAPRDSRQAA